nr:MAG TPA: hypothetical protein [Myoviridae sp. ct1TR10]
MRDLILREYSHKIYNVKCVKMQSLFQNILVHLHRVEIKTRHINNSMLVRGSCSVKYNN